MTTPELSAITGFFDRYKKHTQSQVEEFQTKFDALKTGFSRIRDEVLEEARMMAPAFNVFSVLGLSRDEARTHSAMLAQLLRPDGSHGQQFLFLTSFLRYCAKKYSGFPLPSEDIASGRWIVRTEIAFLEGRMDIVIQSRNIGCLYVIENKVDASEQDNQLFRYSRWMQKQQDDYPFQALRFLTPMGRPSLCADTVEYCQLSYRKDIATWLIEVMPLIQAERVRMVVQQYQELVAEL